MEFNLKLRILESVQLFAWRLPATVKSSLGSGATDMEKLVNAVNEDHNTTLLSSVKVGSSPGRNQQGLWLSLCVYC